MTTRVASCACRQLSASCEGAPARVSVCHCTACKTRTGSAFSWNARWPETSVRVSGPARRYDREGDEGSHVSYFFCPYCGVLVYYQIDAMPGWVAIPVGAFADPDFPPPTVSVYDPARRCAWVGIETEPLERIG